MDDEQAREVLSAYRPDGSDADDPAFMEALEKSQQDSDLAVWLKEQNVFDQKMRQAVKSMPVPSKLAASIRLSTPPVKYSVFNSRAWLAMAAAVIFVLAVVYFMRPPQDGRLTFAALDSHLQPLTDRHQHSFGTSTHEIGKIRDWLAAKGAPHDFSLPSKLDGLSTVGCEVVTIQGATISLLCFHMGGDRTAHLYVIDRSKLLDPPPEFKPEFRQEGHYAVASWSDEKWAYILMEQGDRDSVKSLLGGIPPFSLIQFYTLRWNKNIHYLSHLI